MAARKSLIAAAFSLAVVASAAVAVAHYLTSVPGQPYDGPLPPLQNKEAATATHHKSHVIAIASKPHNV